MAELQDINSSGELTEIKLGGTADENKVLTSANDIDLGDNSLTVGNTIVNGNTTVTAGNNILSHKSTYTFIGQDEVWGLLLTPSQATIQAPSFAIIGDVEGANHGTVLQINSSTDEITLDAANTTINGNTILNGNLTATQFKLSALNTAPTSASDTGTLGEIRYDDTYMYLCVATDTWKRSLLETW